MKLGTWIAAATLAVAGHALAATDHDHGTVEKPKHGGMMVKASDLDFELVAKAELITLYVVDHGKPAATQGASGKLTLLSGTQKTEAQLAPAGDNALEAKGNFKVGAGTKLVATVLLQGKKPVNVRFELK